MNIIFTDTKFINIIKRYKKSFGIILPKSKALSSPFINAIACILKEYDICEDLNNNNTKKVGAINIKTVTIFSEAEKDIYFYRTEY